MLHKLKPVKTYYGLLLLVLVVALAVSPTQGDGWFWETGNGIGFVALAAILYLFSNGRNGQGWSKNHKLIGYGALLAILLHAFWFLLGDPVVIEYLKAGSPLYMVFGVVAVLLILALIFTSISSFRTRSYSNHSAFRFWHNGLSLVIVLMSVWHIAASGYYFESVFQWLLISVVVVFVYYRPKQKTSHEASGSPLLLLSVTLFLVTLFSLIRNEFS